MRRKGSEAGMTKPRPPKLRSAVTNGTRAFLEPVGQTEVARRYLDLLEEAQRERGGEQAMTVSQREAARAWAALAVRLEQMHTDLAAGRKVDDEAMGQLGDRMDRQARRMGPPKAPERPDMRTHFAARRAAQGAK